MSENKSNRGAVRIDPDVMDLIIDEQVRLRRLEGKKPSYSEIIRRMWSKYIAAPTTEARGTDSTFDIGNPGSNAGTLSEIENEKGKLPLEVPDYYLHYYLMLRQILEGGIPQYVQGIVINLEWGALATKLAAAEGSASVDDDTSEGGTTSGSTSSSNDRVARAIESLDEIRRLLKDRAKGKASDQERNTG